MAKYKKGEKVFYLGMPAEIKGTHECIVSDETLYHVRYKKLINRSVQHTVANYVHEREITEGPQHRRK